MDDQIEALISSLSHHVPSANVVPDIEQLRQAYIEVADALGSLVPAGRERSLAITHLEDSLMWAVKAQVLPK